MSSLFRIGRRKEALGFPVPSSNSQSLLAPAARRNSIKIFAARWLFFFLKSAAFQTHAATLVYSTYFGGSGYDRAFAVAVDAAGNAYVAGGTTSTNNFPVLNALQPNYGGGATDGIIAKFDPEGHLLFSSYFGGSGYDYINAIALDAEGNILIGGETHSTDLPTTDDAFQPDYNAGSAFGYGDGFIAKITSDGSRILYCSYFGGSGDEKVNSLVIDTNGSLCITGQTDSRNLPLKNPLQRPFGGGESDGYIAKFDSTLTNLIFSTYFGGENRDEDQKIAVDPAGFIYLCGQTLSTNFPVTAGAFQTNHVVVPEIGQNWDAFVAKFTPDGSALVYSSYVGGATTDAAFAIAVDSEGSAYLTGFISAGWDPGTLPLGFQPTPGYGGGDAWVAKLKPDGSNFAWFTYLGGAGDEVGYGIALDRENNVYITGITDSLDFPVFDAPQPRFAAGTQDAFVAKVRADGEKLIYSTYLGGLNEEWGFALGLDTGGNVIAVGQSASLDFPVRDAVQATNASLRTLYQPADAYIVKLSPAIEQPRLNVARSGKRVLISWPTNFIGFLLESTTTGSDSLVWVLASEPILNVGGQNTVVETASNGVGRLYRLRRP